MPTMYRIAVFKDEGNKQIALSKLRVKKEKEKKSIDSIGAATNWGEGRMVEFDADTLFEETGLSTKEKFCIAPPPTEFWGPFDDNLNEVTFDDLKKHYWSRLQPGHVLVVGHFGVDGTTIDPDGTTPTILVLDPLVILRKKHEKEHKKKESKPILLLAIHANAWGGKKLTGTGSTSAYIEAGTRKACERLHNQRHYNCLICRGYKKLCMAHIRDRLFDLVDDMLKDNDDRIGVLSLHVKKNTLFKKLARKSLKKQNDKSPDQYFVTPGTLRDKTLDPALMKKIQKKLAAKALEFKLAVSQKLCHGLVKLTAENEKEQKVQLEGQQLELTFSKTGLSFPSERTSLDGGAEIKELHKRYNKLNKDGKSPSKNRLQIIQLEFAGSVMPSGWPFVFVDLPDKFCEAIADAMIEYFEETNEAWRDVVRTAQNLK